MAHHYQVVVTEQAGAGKKPCASMEFEVENHDDIFAVIGKLENRKDIPADDVKAFGVGLKLFSEVMVKNRHLPLFATLAPHFREFMQQLKKG